MKVLLVLLVCAIATATAPPKHESHDVIVVDSAPEQEVQSRNILINALIRQLIAYIRYIVNNGSSLFGISPLDPLKLDDFHLVVPAGLINLDLQLKNALMIGLGDFVVDKSELVLRPELTFDIDVSVPRLDISTEVYDLTGDLLTAIPLYGNGKAEFVVENFRFQAKLYLGQSEDGNSIIIDRIEGANFQIPYLESNIEGAIGGGDIDKIVNAIVEEVLMGYVNRFHGAIAALASHAVIAFCNPILEQLDTWRFIAPFL